MTTRLEIFNLALGHIGQSDQLQSPDENSKPGEQCRRFYGQCKREALQDLAWPFATRVAPLALVSDAQNIGYAFTYQRPADALRLWTVCPSIGMRTWLNASWQCWGEWERYSLPQVPWRQVGQQLLTDLDEAYCLYTADVAETQMTDAMFVGALALRLAAAIATPMLGSPTGQQVSAALGRAVLALRSEAIAGALNEQGQDYRPESPAIQARW